MRYTTDYLIKTCGGQCLSHQFNNRPLSRDTIDASTSFVWLLLTHDWVNEKSLFTGCRSMFNDCSEHYEWPSLLTTTNVQVKLLDVVRLEKSCVQGQLDGTDSCTVWLARIYPGKNFGGKTGSFVVKQRRFSSKTEHSFFPVFFFLFFFLFSFFLLFLTFFRI